MKKWNIVYLSKYSVANWRDLLLFLKNLKKNNAFQISIITSFSKKFHNPDHSCKRTKKCMKLILLKFTNSLNGNLICVIAVQTDNYFIKYKCNKTLHYVIIKLFIEREYKMPKYFQNYISLRFQNVLHFYICSFHFHAPILIQLKGHRDMSWEIVCCNFKAILWTFCCQLATKFNWYMLPCTTIKIELV